MPILRKLAPCPFCRQTQNGPVHDRLCFDGTDYEVDQDYEIRIHCTTCGAAGPKVRHDANPQMGEDALKNLACDLWNDRGL